MDRSLDRDRGYSPGRTSFQRRVHRMTFPLIILTLLSFLLQGVGIVAPGWIITRREPVIGNTIKANIGIWFVHYCIGSDCDSRSASTIETYNVTNNLTEFRVETTIAILLILLAELICVFIRHPGKEKIVTWIVIISSLLSGILALVASGKLGDDTRRAHNDLGSASPFKFPYALFITGLGGIVALIVFLIALIGIRPCFGGHELPRSYGSSRRQRGIFYPSSPYPNQAYAINSYDIQNDDPKRSSGRYPPGRYDYDNNDRYPSGRYDYDNNSYNDRQ